MNKVKTIFECSGGFGFACKSRHNERVDVYPVQQPIDGKLSYGQVIREGKAVEIYNPNFEVMA